MPKRRPRVGRIVLSIFLVLILALGIGVFSAWNWVDDQLNKQTWLTSKADTAGESWLILGSDEREGNIGDAGDVEGFRTDTILVLTKPKTGSSSLISIPRDSLVEIDGSYMKINAVAQLYSRKQLVNEVEDITGQMLACGADITQINTIRKRLSGVKGGRFAQLCAPAHVYAILLSDVIGDPPDMIASGPAYPDSTTTAQAMALVSRYGLTLSPQALDLLEQEPPKVLDNVTTVITGSVAQLCRDAAARAEALGYRTCLLTDRLQCEAREAGRFLSAMAGTHAGKGEKTAYILGGETVVHLTGRGLGGRNQELALAAAEGLAGLEAVVASVGSDGTDGPTDAAGGITDGATADALAALGISIDKTLADNDAYHALKACGGLIVTGPTGTNVNDITVLLV